MATKAELERDVLIAEARKLNAEALVAEQEAESNIRVRKNQLASTSQHRLYHFFGPVGAASVKDCMEKLGTWSRREPGEAITIVFNSPGGSVFEGLALYDFLTELKSKGHHITTVARGMAASMGGILLQAGDERIIGEHAHVLIHEVSSGARGTTSDIEDDLKFTKRLQDRCLSILAERSTLTKTQIARRWKKTDWWLDSEESVSLGFADKIG